MKINRCQFCDSFNIRRSRYFGTSFVAAVILTFGFALLGTPWLPITVDCRDCHSQYIPN
jgi:hypothetical protein